MCIEGQGHLLALALGHLHTKIKIAFLGSHWVIFSQILNVSLQVQENENLSLCLKYQITKRFRFCSNYEHSLTLTYFIARSNFAIKSFIWEIVTMKDYLDITAPCELEFGSYS